MEDAQFLEENKKKGGCAKYFAIGCFTMIILVVVGGVALYHYGAKWLVNQAMEYTADQPEVFPQVKASEAEAKLTINAFDQFFEEDEGRSKHIPLVLTTKQLNILVQKHPDLAEFAKMGHVNIDDDKLTAEVSIPLDDVHEMLAGRYFNGGVTFTMSLANGRLAIYVEDLSIKGESLPAPVIDAIGSENFAKEMNKDPEMREVFAKLEKLEVKDGKLYIVPKK